LFFFFNAPSYSSCSSSTAYQKEAKETQKKERKTPSKGEQKNLLPFFSNVYSTFFLLSSSFARAAAASSSRLAALETCFFKSLPLSLSFSYSLCFSPPFPLCCVFLFVDSLHK